MAQILKISDGTTTVDFLNDSAYRILSWSPAVAPRNVGEWGRCPYSEVVEDMTIFVSDAQATTKLATLRRLIDQAERWSRGENVDTVRLHYKLTSSSTELIAPIFGPPSPGAQAIILPKRYGDVTATQTIDQVTLKFKRLGVWLANTISGEDVAASSNVTHPTVATMLLTGTSYADSPYRLTLAGLSWREEIVWQSYFLAVNADTTTNAAKKLILIDAEDMASSNPSSQSDTTNKARGNNVLRFDFTSNNSLISATKDVSSLTHPSVRRWAVYACCRTDSIVPTRVAFYGQGSSRTAQTPLKTIAPNFNHDYTGSKPAWIYLGSFSLPDQLKKVYMSVDIGLESSGGTIDFDSIVLMANDASDYSRAVTILGDSLTYPGTAIGSNRGLTLQHGLNYGITPYAYITDSANVLFQNYNGNPAFFAEAKSPAVAAIWLACGRYNTNYWRPVDASNNLITSGFAVDRMKGTLTVY